jgi:hypothetical protein
MNAAAPRIGIAALAVVTAAAITFCFVLPSSTKRPSPKAHAEVSITQLVVDKDMSIAPAPAAEGAVDTVTVQATR